MIAGGCPLDVVLLATRLVLAAGLAGTAEPARAAPAAVGPRRVDAIRLTVAHGDDWTKSWLFDRTGQVRWYEVTLDKGQDYAFWASSWGDEGWTGFRSPTVTVYGPAGEQLVVLSPSVNFSPIGREFRAPATSTYY